MAEVDSGCDLYDCGRCRKFDARETCAKHRSDRSWFTDKLQVCEVGEVCRQCSIFGNAYFKITAEQLDALKDGKVLFDIDEYGTFIMLDA